jgi:hypothetical protein
MGLVYKFGQNHPTPPIRSTNTTPSPDLTNDLNNDPIQFVPPSVTATPPRYDLDGNLLSDGRWTYAWNGENRLVKMASIAWTQHSGGYLANSKEATRDALDAAFKDGYNANHLEDIPTRELNLALKKLTEGLQKLKSNPRCPSQQIGDFAKRIEMLESYLQSRGP